MLYSEKKNKEFQQKFNYIDFINNRQPTKIVTYKDLIECRYTLSTLPIAPNNETYSNASASNFELYKAFRDCLAPRERVTTEHGIWRGDLIQYSGIELPNHELCRSIGHWNPSDQLEIFEVLHGHIMMLIQCPLGYTEYLDCYPGSSWIVPKGSFHLTYSITDSIVINIYNSSNLEQDLKKYNRQTIPNVFIESKEEVVNVLKYEDSFLLSDSINEYANSSCKNIPYALGYLHSLDDESFSNLIIIE